MTLNTNEALDAMLAVETISIRNARNEEVKGNFTLIAQESKVVFTPYQPWKSGTYTVSVASILEDLAGNNLNHLFDVDLTNVNDAQEQLERRTISFEIP